MASIRKLPSGKYQVQIRLKNLKPIAKSFTTKKNAQAFIRQVEGDTELLRQLGKPSSRSIPFDELCDRYMKQYRGRDASVTSRVEYWKNRFQDTDVTKIDEFMVDDALVELAAKLTGSTINRYKSTLSAICIFFIQHPEFKRLGYTNPVRRESVSKFSENPARQRFLSTAEQEALLAACKTVPWNKLYLLVLMALTTGARRGELLSLRWADLSFKARTASLETTKNGKPRLLPLTQPVIEELIKFRSSPQSLVFNCRVSPDRPFDPKKSWGIALKEAGIDHLRFHDLRHTAASNLVKAGRTLFEVGTLLGHSSTTMTARYAHLAIHDTMNMVDSVMGGLK